MIWNPESTGDDEKSAIVSHITAEIEEVCGSDLTLDKSKIEELAKAVESFIQGQSDDGTADSRYLIMLASKALSSLGQNSAGRRLLVFGTGLVKPSEWDVTGEDAVWTLDLREMMISDSTPLELVFFGSLGMVIESISEVWDNSEGRGVLGLKNVFSTAVSFLGRDSGGKDLNRLAAEIKTVCEKKLEQLKTERKWNYLPRVMNLDI